MEVDPISLATTPVFLLKDEKPVSQGTGFFYVQEDSATQILYLVTNYHVLTGASPLDEKPPMGDRISFQFHLSREDTGQVKTEEYPLFTRTGKPVWITNPSCREADLAVIPLPTPLAYEGRQMTCIFARDAETQFKVRPTTSVTLIGYPYGYYDKRNALPVWKTGSVASEPKADFEGLPFFLVDVSAFPGMSGSPVFAVASGVYELESGRDAIGRVRKFLGIYASMQMRGKRKYLEEIAQGSKVGILDYESLELGHIWKAHLIQEAISTLDIEKYEREVLRNLV